MRRHLVIVLSMSLFAGLCHGQQDPSAPVVNTLDLLMQGGHSARQLNRVEVEYPADARSKGMPGRCVLLVTADVTGMPQDAEIIHCTDPIFAQNSLKAASQCRFAPAAKRDGTPVAVRFMEDFYFGLDHGKAVIPVRYDFRSVPDTTPALPDAAGLYPLTKSMSPPTITLVGDEGSGGGYGDTAFRIQGNGACDVELTIDKKGTPSDVGTVHCEKKVLEKLAAESLLKSKFKPAKLNGKTVPIRVTVHLQLPDSPPFS